MFQQGEFEQANHFSGITALVDAALTSHDDPAAEIAPLEAPGAPAQHPVQQIAQIDVGGAERGGATVYANLSGRPCSSVNHGRGASSSQGRRR